MKRQESRGKLSRRKKEGDFLFGIDLWSRGIFITSLR